MSSTSLTTFRIGGICGSLRKESYNRKLILRAQELCSEHVKGATINIIDWSQLPVYNQDLEEDPPQPVLNFKKEISDHDAILVATPEYNFSIPGPLKNAIDWASRSTISPELGAVFSGKAVAIIGAGPSFNPGSSGSGRAQLALRQSFVSLNMIPVNHPSITITGAGSAFNEDGRLADEYFEQKIVKVLQNLVKLGRQLRTNPE